MRAPLERCGAVVTRSPAHRAARRRPTGHTSELLRYDQAYPDRRGDSSIDDLIVAGVRAAVVAARGAEPCPLLVQLAVVIR